MTKIARFVLWLCKNFTRQELEEIIRQLQQILSEREPEIKPRDAFREEHPHYRDFYVDPLAPLTQAHPPHPPTTVDWKQRLAQYQQQHGKSLPPVRRRGSQRLPAGCRCAHCQAPADYLYLNNGRLSTQLRCKICSHFSPLQPRHRPQKTVYWCPYCGRALYRWKERADCTLYKCGSDACPHYQQRKAALAWKERLLAQLRPSQFKLRYQYRQYHFRPQQLSPSAPRQLPVDLRKIHRSSDVLGLVLAFHISFALSARRTAQVLRQVFAVPLSYQTVLNYAHSAAYYCHQFNRRHKPLPSSTATGDETYIRVAGKHHYSFFFLDPTGHQISAYHVAPERDVLAATTTMNEALQGLPAPQSLHFITDGNPAYQAGLHFLNAQRPEASPHTLSQVLGLQNLDQVSTEYRHFKQLIERLNRTYKHHVRSASGFASRNGAVALTALFVTYYNFLRPHHSLGHRPPVSITELASVSTLQGRWNKILQMALAA
jgi:transposase-like protein